MVLNQDAMCFTANAICIYYGCPTSCLGYAWHNCKEVEYIFNSDCALPETKCADELSEKGEIEKIVYLAWCNACCKTPIVY